MKNNSYIVWIGGIFDESTILKSKAVSPAANHWQKCLINGLEEQGLSVITLGHLYEPMFPKGRLRVKSSDATLDNSMRGELISYWNLPLIKDKLLTKSYINELNALCKKRGKPVAVLVYNAYSYCVDIGLYAQKCLGISTVCIVADGLEKDIQLAKLSNGVVFLSWGAYQKSSQHSKLHLDGGIEKINWSEYLISETTKNRNLKILYTGGTSAHGGIDFLLHSFSNVRYQNIELWICGKGSFRQLEQLSQQDSRIKCFGLVSEKRLEELYQQADVFVNPRPSSLDINKFNFPSKIFQYLSYGKPIISTWTDGLSPDYRDLLIVIDELNTLSLNQAIEDIIQWSDVDKQNLKNKIKKFVQEKKLWKNQARKMYDWLMQEFFIS